MSVAWHRTEPREVRPFFETAKAENALDDSGICLFAKGDTSRDTSFDLDEIDFQKLEPIIHAVLVDPTQWMPEGLTARDLELVLIAKNSFLKRSEIVARSILAEPIPTYFPIGSELLAKLGGGRNVQFTLALCLATDRPPTPGSPFVPGHWLARKTFLLRSRTLPALFDLQTRTDEAWKAAGYPEKTFFAVDYAGGIAGEMDDGSSVATVYIHIDAHNGMVNSPIGAPLQPILASEIILSIVTASKSEWKDLDEFVPSSPLETLSRQLGDAEPLTLDTLKKLANDPSRLRAVLQDRLSVVRGIK
ncbi:hypothetical protein [Mesorhizobium sp. B2-3-12]|uniref:hypothetical protein n=1 Tax=Mesorhizobium sp. B2-3-12 TaxID=2589952 RepID=UPI00112B49E9|nr:hypothetical protein [Mesorhizobium sp. B2-3-12]TPL93814.1 hypothetical protein FJ948_08125 [Mesorhizobium sp. B2-3-12]